jgi:branched-chain amino acid transport system permease protein
MLFNAPIGDIILSAFVLSGSYVLLGLSWVIIFRATRVLNLAVGQFMALGAYLAFALLVTLHIPFLLTMLLAVISIALFAGMTFHLFVRPLHGQPHFVVVVLTIGWSIVIGGAISIIWGPDLHVLPQPVHNTIYPLPAGARLSTYGGATMAVAFVLGAALIAFFRFSRLGMRMRAASELPVLASQSGVNITILFFIAWALAGVTATLAGVGYGYTNVVSPSVAQVGLRGLTPALIGGFESLPGTIAGAVILAFVETLGVRLLGGDAEDAVVAAVLFIFLMLRPTGVFGEREVRRV